MPRALQLPIFVAAAPASLSLCTSAGASTVTVGGPLVGTFEDGGTSSGDGMVANITVGAAGANATSPLGGPAE